MSRSEAPITNVRARAYTIPTDRPEADGTFAWDSTTLVVVHAEGGGKTGLGYTYTHESIVALIESKLKAVVSGTDAMDPPAAFTSMQRAVRNFGREGLAATAISAVDAALWDLKARLLDLPLCTLLGRVRDAVAIYGSGGFTTYSLDEVEEQLCGWAERDGCRWVKMKIGTHPDDDPVRVGKAAIALNKRASLFVDANGGYTVKQAFAMAEAFSANNVGWFEEPVSSDDLEGLRLVRHRAPAGMDIAAGEYGYDIDYYRRIFAAGAVDVIQADVTRCGGVTGFLQVAALADAHHIDLSGHCAPSLHLHVACAAPRLRHLEWFHDHVRIEHMLFDGAPHPSDGKIKPDPTRPGCGLELKRDEAERWAR